MNLTDQLAELANVRPKAVALIDRSRGSRRTMTFAKLDSATASGAKLLRTSGIAPGDRVFFAQPVSIELYVGILSTLRAGATAVFADVSSGRKHLDAACSALRPKAFFGSGRAQLLRLISSAIRKIPIHFCTVGPFGAIRWDTTTDTPFPPVSVPGDQPALITFTSGSTGTPKVIARSHDFLLAQNRSLSETLSLNAGEVDLVTLPVFAFANLAAGVTSSLADTNLRFPGNPDPHAVRRQIADDQIGRATASPAFFESLIEDGVDFGRLTKIYTGGAPVFPRLLEALRLAAPKAQIISVYGSSEAEPIAEFDATQLTDDDHHAMKNGTGLLAGTPVPSIALRILPNPWKPRAVPLTSDEFDGIVLPSGRAGEIIVAGDHVLPGYLDGLGDERTKIRVDDTVWHRTGDLGRIDRHGKLWLLGRSSAAIRDPSGIIYPLAAECALSYLSEIRRSAIVAHEGQRIAVIESDKRVEDDTIRSAIPWADIGDVIHRTIPLDRRHNAKVDYPRLRSAIGSAAKGRVLTPKP